MLWQNNEKDFKAYFLFIYNDAYTPIEESIFFILREDQFRQPTSNNLP